MILQATHWWNDDRGRRHRDNAPATGVAEALQAIAEFWTDPYTNLGHWKRADPAKSHPGARLPCYEGFASD